MSWMTSVFARYWRNLHLAVVAALSVLLILHSFGADGLVSQAIIGSVYYPFFKLRAAVTDFVGVRDENERLNRALVEASIRLSQFDEIRRENERLREIIQFQSPTSYKIIPARVIAVAGTRFPTGATLNRGSADGIIANLPIINQYGLIGRVIGVESHTATAQFLSDPANRVAVRLSQSREMGIIRYSPATGFMMDNFPTAGSITEGDTVVSSGLGGVYPAGLMVGRVVTIERPVDIPFCEVTIEPMVNFNALEEVFVIKSE
jgi:rod shape-determining protein MreC